MTSVAVVGLGGMGSRMARRLLDAEHDVVVWNRTADKASPLADLGAALAESPAAAAGRTEAAIIMVADPGALRTVTEAPDGVFAGAGAGFTVLQMATVGPAAVSRLASAAPQGVDVLDAPVLGSLSEVEEGSLDIFVGGTDAQFERWKPLLSALGSPIHVGPFGAGSSAKLVANLTLFGVLGALGEALELAQALGLPREVTFEVLSKTPLSAQAERRRPAVESGEYAVRFPLELALKDASLIAEAARGAGVELRLSEAARSLYADAVRDGWGERDYASILSWLLGKAEDPPAR